MTKLYNRRNLGSFRRDLRQQMTKSEVVLWKYLKGDNLGFRFRRQHSIGKYIVDFYCPSLKLAIEVDGLTHNNGVVFKRDGIKQKFLERNSIIVKRYDSQSVLRSIRQVVENLYFTCKQLAEQPSSATPPTPS